MIEAKDLRFRYGDDGFGLHVSRFRVERGERVAIVGSSGSGKTTLISLVSGMLLPTAGTMVVDGTDLARRSDTARRAFRLRRIGFVFQEFELLDYLSARENILLPFLLSNEIQCTRQVEEMVDALAHAMQIRGELSRRPGTLSQGERQRVAICRALVTEPALIIADEPTGSLDPPTALTIRDLLLEQAAKRGATLLAVTHNHALLDAFDRVVEIADLLDEVAS